MNAQVLAHFPMTWLSCIALLLFFTVFVTMFARVFMASNTELYQRIGQLPLGEDKGDRHE